MKYDNKIFTYYVTDCWHKNLWKFMLLLEFNFYLDIIEAFKDPPLLWQHDVYLMLAFEENGFRKEDLN